MVLFNNNNPSQNSAVNEIKSKNRVEEMIEKFEEKDVNFKDKLANKFRIKEKGIVIKVKKNQIEENMSPEVIDDSMANIKNLYTENLQEEKVSRSQNENSLLDENKKIKENMNEKNAIDYSDYIIDNDNDFLEPLI